MLVAALKRASVLLNTIRPALNVRGTIKDHTIDTEDNPIMLLQRRILRPNVDLHGINSRLN
jgi:hypothetical protein